jgi:hypothetical protein
MKIYICICALLAIVLCASSQAQDKVRVPRGKAILIDGKFSPGEWQDSAELAISDAARLYFKTSDEYVYICVRLMKPINFGLDMYVSDSTKEIHNLHASAKLGERQLKDNNYPDWQWWTNRDWTANVSRVNSFEERTFLPDEVKELQISKQRFKGKQWLTMFEIQTRDNTKAFPIKATNKKTENWLLLEFNK